MTAIAVLGFGEAGLAITADLVALGADVRGFDPGVPAPPGVRPRADEADAVSDADLVLSVNSAMDARDALLHARSALRGGTIWADLNTSSPGLKRQLVADVADLDVTVVDVALMAPVPGNGLRTPMVASGQNAHRFADVMAGFGVTPQLIEGPAGMATSRKLLRSVFYKGLAAAVVEALAGARAASCEQWLGDNIAAELAGFEQATLDFLISGTHRHARRRADEMAAATEQLRELGVQPRVAAAARDLLVDLRDRAGAGP